MNDQQRKEEPEEVIDDTAVPAALTNQYPLIDFDQVAGESTTVLIRFQDAVYTLKRTRNNRLVLHK